MTQAVYGLGQECKVEIWLERRIFSLLINKWAFSMQIEIIYLATSGMIFLDFVFRRCKSSEFKFCWRENDLLAYKIYKEGRSSQTWEDGNN